MPYLATEPTCGLRCAWRAGAIGCGSGGMKIQLDRGAFAAKRRGVWAEESPSPEGGGGGTSSDGAAESPGTPSGALMRGPRLCSPTPVES
ncbi:MAG: hypothetical protein ACYC35_16915 [Pirellulales bacterium]